MIYCSARYSFLTFFVLLFIFLGATDLAYAITYDSKLIKIEYDSPDDLKAFADKIRPVPVTVVMGEIMFDLDHDKANLGTLLAMVYKRVQMLLDMALPNRAFKIRIHSTPQGVLEAFKSAGGVVSQYQNSHPLAFYHKKTNTIHLQTETLTMGMLAHEMGHVVQLNYFVIAPPLKVQEMLCQYIDREISAGRF